MLKFAQPFASDILFQIFYLQNINITNKVNNNSPRQPRKLLFSKGVMENVGFATSVEDVKYVGCLNTYSVSSNAY